MTVLLHDALAFLDDGAKQAYQKGDLSDLLFADIATCGVRCLLEQFPTRRIPSRVEIWYGTPPFEIPAHFNQ